jgi:hypothetical protein
MTEIQIPEKLKKTFQFKTRELIFLLNQELESNDFVTDSDSFAYLKALSEIQDMGKRYEVMMKIFADALCE